uniref:Uncharacterized protein n=1 Tax=Oryza barthii TaxID=65489 RepID=A0A0D3H4L2_9ORYZ
MGKQIKHCSQGFLVMSLIPLGCFTIPVVHSQGIATWNGESYGIDINNVTACIRKPFSSQFCCQNKNSSNLGRCYGSVSDCQSNCPNVLDPHV